MPVAIPGLSSTIEPRAKKAVLVGISYESNTNLAKNGLAPQPGAYKDVCNLRDLLINQYGYSPENITLLVDDKKSVDVTSNLWPTQENIMKAAEQLVANSRAGDHIVFAFSGHGGQVEAIEDKDEPDGLDEVLLAEDALYDPSAPSNKLSNFIRDDDIRKQFVGKLPNEVRCVLIFDCCHSGTASDLPYSDDYLLTPTSPIRSPTTKGSRSYVKMDTVHALCTTPIPYEWPSGPSMSGSDSDSYKNVTAWSACHDEQITFGGQTGGVFMKAFVNALKKQPQPTHQELLRALTKELDQVVKKKNAKTQRQKGPSVSEADLLVAPRPQLGSLRPNGIKEMQFFL